MPLFSTCTRLSLVLFLASFPAFSWWETGHQTVARIAAAHLTPAARTGVARILEVPDTPEAVADALAAASIWADQTKSETHTGDWHYIDLALQDTPADIPLRCSHDNCAPARIEFFRKLLASNEVSSRWSRLDSLRYVIHFVGDIHQPLHAVSDADLGGNCERLADPLGEAKNLHALWDGGIIEQMDVSERSLANRLNQEIDAWTDSRRNELGQGTVNDWTWESHELAIQDVYHRLHIPTEPVEFPKGCAEAPAAITDFQPRIDGLYIDDMKPVIRLQLEKGGLRLAHLLNTTL